MENVILLGPYIGDWETEINIFRPYMKWISEVIDCNDIYLATHSNRMFLYDWIDPKNMIPVYGNLSRDELAQKGSINTTLNQKDYFIIQRQIIQKINTEHDAKVIPYGINYTKRLIFYPYYKRIFNEIHYEKTKKKKKYFVFIPDISENINNTNELYEFLNDNFNIIVCGDMKIHLQEKNIALKKVNYFNNGYQNIINIISNASAVICPLSHWTLICRLQNVPVISWITKRNDKYMGLESNNDKNCKIINDSSLQIIKNMLYSFLEEK